MAEAGMFATTDMVPPLANRGITLSREQVYRLVTGVPERLSLPVLAALCDILDCGPGDLIEPVRKPARKEEPAAEPQQRPRPVRARVVPGPGARCGPLPGRARAAWRPPAGGGVPGMPPGHADPARHRSRRGAARQRGRRRGGRGRRYPGRAAGTGRGAGRRP
jgi:DNA-binding Xre family transcriptional regulator